MISDYVDCGGIRPGEEGMQPTFDVWGMVLAASDNTKKGNLRVRIKAMKEKMDTFDNVPVLTAYGGGNYGAFFLPEEGDIVRLTFLGGDLRHPVVTGCRFPESSQFVQDMHQKENLKKAWKIKNGSEIVFSGEKGKEKIEVSGPEKMKWELDEEKQKIDFGDKDKKNHMTLDKKEGKTTVVAEKEICLECGKSSLKLKEDGTIVLKCEKLTLEAKNIQIEGKTKVQIKGQQLELDGSTGITVTGKGNVKVESKGQLKLSGAMIHLN